MGSTIHEKEFFPELPALLQVGACLLEHTRFVWLGSALYAPRRLAVVMHLYMQLPS